MVSICMATYNGAKFIKEQINSIISQINANDELIISDDMSTDNTVEIIEGFRDNRIKLFKHLGVGRPTENFQNALEKANGEIIFLADQDDIWLPNKYNEQKNLLLTYDLVVSDSIVVDENLTEIFPSFFDFHGSKKGIIRNSIKNSYFGSCMAFKKSLLKYALPFPKSREIGHDVWIGLVAEMTGTVLFYKKPMILYRRHGSAVTSHGIGQSKRSLFKKAFGRLIMLTHVLIFYVKFNGKRISIHRNAHV